MANKKRGERAREKREKGETKKVCTGLGNPEMGDPNNRRNKGRLGY